MSKTLKLPSYKDPQEMANRFETYFVEKVQNIRKNLVAGNTCACDPHEYDVASDVRLKDLAITNTEEVIKFIRLYFDYQNNIKSIVLLLLNLEIVSFNNKIYVIKLITHCKAYTGWCGHMVIFSQFTNYFLFK